MTTKTYDMFKRDIIMLAPSCTESVAKHMVMQTVIDFCNNSRWWRYTTDPMDVTAGEKSYQIEVPNGTDPVAIVAAWYKSRPLAILGWSSKNRAQPYNLDDRRGSPELVTQDIPTEAVLSPVPDVSETEAVVLQIALRPQRNATGADGEMLDRWYDAILNGALARVYAIPNQPFTSPDAAMARQKLYLLDLTKAKIDANKALTSASLRVQPRQP